MMKIYLLLLLSISLWANIGNIMVIKGDADVVRSLKEIKATAGMELLKGDKIKTSKNSRVQVMLKDDTVVTIGANSLFGFEDFVFDGTKKSKVSMKAVRGFFRSVTGKIGKIAPERFKVKTASATIGIRGTDFSGDISLKSEVFTCYSGRINVEYEGGSIDVDAGKFLRLSTGVEKTETLKQQVVKNKKISVKSLKEDGVNHRLSTPKVELEDISTSDIVEPEIEVEIPTEVISDITQSSQEICSSKTESEIISDPEPDPEPDSEPETEPEVEEEPFELEQGSEDREEEY